MSRNKIGPLQDSLPICLRNIHFRFKLNSDVGSEDITRSAKECFSYWIHLGLAEIEIMSLSISR